MTSRQKVCCLKLRLQFRVALAAEKKLPIRTELELTDISRSDPSRLTLPILNVFDPCSEGSSVCNLFWMKAFLIVCMKTTTLSLGAKVP